MASSGSPREVFERAHALVRNYDLGFADCFASDGVLELPFAPIGMPRRLVGRAAIRELLAPAYHAARQAGRRILGYAGLRLHDTGDPEVAVAEFTLQGQAGDGASYELPFIQVLRARGGEIVELRDYFDAFALASRLRPAAQPSPRQVVELLLATITEGRWDAAAELYADDAVVLHPMDPPGYAQLRGKDELRAHFARGRDRPFTMQARNLVFHETTDSEVVIVEFDYLGRVNTSGRVFQLSCVFVTRVRNGKIVSSHDYGNRLTLAHALGQIPELLARLDGSV
jgi:ketosteroid isomerase-like protein